MKATLTFDLPEDRHEFRLAQMGPGLYGVIFDLRERYLRTELDRENLSADARDALENLRTWLNDELNGLDYNIDTIP
jgi:hypothetical protein